MGNETNIFQVDKYKVIRNVLDQRFCEVIVNYAKFQASYDFTPEIKERAQVAETHSRYADFLMEALLLDLQPKVEEAVKASLIPTYSYYRVYKKGDILDPHVDRDACEISVTLAFGWPNSFPWPFLLSNDKSYIDGTPECHIHSSSDKTIVVHLAPGDALVYAGPKVKHWRESLESTAYVQGFFHYVLANGLHTSEKFDGREAIGKPKINSQFEYFEHSRWIKALLEYKAKKEMENL